MRFSLGRCMQRQADRESRAAPRACALSLDRAAVQLDQLTHDGETETETAVHARHARIGLAEAVEDVRQKLRCDAFAGVRDHDAYVRVRLPRADLDAPA